MIALASLALALTAGMPQSEDDRGGDLAVRAEVLHLGTGERVEDGLVVVRDGRIVAVGPAARAPIPDDLTLLEAAVATPGLIDAHSCVGLAGFLNTDEDSDEFDPTEPLQPELRALDAYNPDDPLVAWLRGFGVTTVHTGHAPRGVVSGQSMVVKTSAPTLTEAVLVETAMVTATLGEAAQTEKGAGTRAKVAAMLRQALVDAEAYAAERETPAEDGAPRPRDLRKEALARVVRGELPLMITAQRAHDLRTALRLAADHPDLRLVLDGAAEAPDLLEEILAAGVPVIVHPTMARSGGETENLSMETPARLVQAGIPTALQSGYESYVPRTRCVLFEAGVAVRYGLSRDQALGLVTLDAARLLGVGDRVGSLEVGKHGDLALFDGDPFEYTSRCIGTVIEGRVASTGEAARLDEAR